MTTLYQTRIVDAFKRATRDSIKLILPDGTTQTVGNTSDPPIAAIEVLDTRFFKEIALRSDIGLGESYINGYWKTDNLTGIIRWLLVNSKDISRDANRWSSKLTRKLLLGAERIQHWLNRNTREGSSRNIAAHYDLGNDFYQEFLDTTMTYSSAFFDSSIQSLEEGQREKYDRICRKLNLGSSHHVLEVGCGWGGFAAHVAREYGCRVTATTISQRQYEFAQERMEREGLSDLVNVILVDYRELAGEFDRIVSIEMIEAVGHDFLSSYFKQLSRLLKGDGLIAIQGILCPSPLYKGYRKRVDYIRKHIFPGAHLPSLAHIMEASNETAGLEMLHHESFGLHYANTLKIWAERFTANWKRIERLGFDDAFRRKWLFYFSYCEAGFMERHINVSQLVFSKPDVTSYRFEEASSAPIKNTSLPKAVAAYAQ